jgi:hypothetical protein
MPDFNIRSDSVNVEQLMEHIRARIREKRGVDYTEQQIRDLAAVKLEKFVDPRGVRSGLLEEYRARTPADLPNYAFEESTLFETHRAPIRWIRKLLNPILKLFFNPNPLIQALHIQSRLNAIYSEHLSGRRVFDELHYEVMHNLVVELTRLGLETKNVKMRLESIASRLEFNERRARALESVVVYKPTGERGSTYDMPQATSASPQAIPSASISGPQPTAAGPQPHEGPGQRSRRRRRRRGRRGGGSAAATMGFPGSTAEAVQQAVAPESQRSEPVPDRPVAPAPSSAEAPPTRTDPGSDPTQR